MPLEKEHILAVIGMIDAAMDRDHVGSCRWVTDTGEIVHTDIPYVYTWWKDGMRPELIRRMESLEK